MSLAVVERRADDIVILDVMGRMRIESGGTLLRAYVFRNLEAERRAFLINLREVPYVDTSGITDLVSIFQLVESRGGFLFLVPLQPYVRAVLEQCGLLGVFTVYVDETPALIEARRRLAT